MHERTTKDMEIHAKSATTSLGALGQQSVHPAISGTRDDDVPTSGNSFNTSAGTPLRVLSHKDSTMNFTSNGSQITGSTGDL